jgi:hypothetical protein
MADSTSPSVHLVSSGVRTVLYVAAVVVSVPAAVVSYVHMHELARVAGEGWLAWLEPLPTDGLVVFASTLLYAQHRAGQKVNWLVVPAIILGVLASLGANVLSREPDLVDPMWLGIVVRAWPPLALAITADLVWQLLGLRQEASREAPPVAVEIGQQVNIGTMTVGSQEAPRPAFQEAPADHPEAIPSPSRQLPPSPPRTARSTTARRGTATVPDEDWMPFLRHLAGQGRDLTPNALKEASRKDGLAPHSIGHDRAKRLIERFQEVSS